MNRFLFCLSLMAFLSGNLPLLSQDSTWKRTDSDGPYFHSIQLRDSSGRVIDPSAPDPALPDLSATCAPCHDVVAASGGLHGGGGPDGKAGEPWFLMDARTATSLPMHHRSWPALFKPVDLAIDGASWSEAFGRHDAGGNAGTTIAGSDCLVCHLAEGYDFAKRIEHFDAGHFSTAPFIAAGLIDAEGNYDTPRFDSDGRINLDLLADAGPDACLPCHTVRNLETAENPRWLHDEDIHLSAGMTCVDCHRSGIAHHIVRGYEGESHPSELDVSSLSCRGCHMGDGGGHQGAPKPLHQGLPPFHLEEIHCTGCHSGPVVTSSAIRQWTSRAHRLGEPSQKRDSTTPPRIIASIWRDDSGKLGPVRLAWPDGWGLLDESGAIRPIAPDLLRRPLRKTLRVRANLAKEISARLSGKDATELIHAALLEIDESIEEEGVPVFFSGGRVLASDGAGALSEVSSDAASAVRWPIAHPVRPARAATGAGGCTDCHSSASRWLSTAVGPMSILPFPGALGASSPLDENIVDGNSWRSWSLLFGGRDVGKVYFSLCAILAISGGLLALWRSLTEEHR